MSNPWIVHQYGLSPNVERLKRVLVRLELPFDVEDYMPFDEAGRTRVAALVERAGHNQMPVLERDGAYYGDSLKIAHMLMTEYPDRAERLYPADPVRAAVVHAFVLAGDNGFLRPEGKFLTDAYKQQKGEDHAVKITAIGNERREIVLAAWDTALATQPFLTGDEYNMADIGVAPFINARIRLPQIIQSMVAEGQPVPFSPEQWPVWDLDAATYPNLRGWLDRVNAPEYVEGAVAAA